MDVTKPMSSAEARKLARVILSSMTGAQVVFSGHALTEMAKDGMVRADVVSILRGAPLVREDGWKGGWRYRFETSQMVAVVTFVSETRLIVVTAWRIRR